MNEAEEKKAYEDWLHQSPEFADTIISAWDVWLGRAALSAQPEPAAPTVVEPDVPAANFGNMEPVASLMTNINSGDVKLVWNDEAFDRALWRETPLYTSPPRTALTNEQAEVLKAHNQLLADANKELRDAAERDHCQIEALRADAERWQFLKTHGISVYYNYGTLSRRQVPCSVMDEDIDAAIKAGKAVTP